MTDALAEELYSESLRLSRERLDSNSSENNKQMDSNDNMDDVWHDYDLDEWQRRHDQFHTIGYRDGLIAGKEEIAQEGFNRGFEESVIGGYKWGNLRGVTSALACLPNGLREKLVETQEKRNKFQSLHESVHSLSTTDALKLLHDNILTSTTAEKSKAAESRSSVSPMKDNYLEGTLLGTYFGELQLLLRKSPEIKVSLDIDQ